VTLFTGRIVLNENSENVVQKERRARSKRSRSKAKAGKKLRR
jgi:hypothetical protein